jgi:hypothetical protein
MRINIGILLFSLLCFTANSQSFFKGFPSKDNKSSTEIKSVIAKNNLFIYNLVHYSNGSAVLKLDMNGSIVWTKNYFNSTNDLEIKDMIETNDGGIVCIGSINSSDASVIFKIDPNGTIQWSIKMGSFKRIFLSSVNELKSGEIVVSGTCWYNSTVYRYYIAKLSSSGNLIWGKVYFVSGSLSTLEPYSIKTAVNQDGNLWSIGHDKFNYQGIIIGINSSNGDTVLTRRIDSFKDYKFINIIATKDSNIFVSGSIGNQYRVHPLIAKFDNKGFQKWSLILDNSESSAVAVRKMTNIGDNDALIHITDYSRISRIDKNGVIKWSKTSNLVETNLSNIYTSQYNDIIITGSHYLSFNNRCHSVLKTDSMATFNCSSNVIGVKTSFLPLNYVSFDSLLELNYFDTSLYTIYSSDKILDTINLSTKVTFNSPTICKGQFAKIVSDADSCIWPLGFTVLSPNSAKISPTQTTTYNIVSFKGGCDYTNKVTVEVIQTPINNSISLTGKTLTTSQSGATYQWINCNDKKPIPGATNQYYTPSANGSYSVITKLGACIDTSDCKSVNMAGLSYLASESIQIYPNPIFANLTIDFPTNIDFVNLRIYSLVGQLLMNDDYKNKQSISLNLSNLCKGFYYLVLDDKIIKRNFKILKD